MRCFFLFTFATLCAAPLLAQEKLTLAEAGKLARRSSLTAQAAKLQREASQAQTDRNRPVALPTVEIGASGILQGPRTTLLRPGGGTVDGQPEVYGQVRLTVEQTLYRAGLGAAKTRYTALSEANRLEYARSLAETERDARRAYVNVLRANAGVQLANEGLASAQAGRTLVQHSIDARLTKPVDATTADAQVVEAEEGVRQAEGGLVLAQQAFNRAIGQAAEYKAALTPLDGLPTAPDDPQAAVDNALRLRPELAQLEQNRRAGQAGVSLAKTQTQPILSVRGQLSEQSASALFRDQYAAIGLELRWPLLDGGKARQDVREARSQAGRLDVLLEDTRQAIALEVRADWQKLRDALGTVRTTQARRKAADALALVAETAYTVGRGTLVESQNAGRERQSARLREQQASYDAWLALIDWEYAQGLYGEGSEAVPPAAGTRGAK